MFPVNENIRNSFAEYGLRKRYKEGDVILDVDSYIRSIPLVTKGTVRVTRTDEEGRELLLYYIRPGETCIMSLTDGLHNDRSKIKAAAEEETEILFLPIEKTAELIKGNPEWLDYILNLYHMRFEELLDIINSIAFKKLDQRLIDFIEKKCEVSESTTLYITHESLANQLGSSRVVISRLLKQLEEQGFIKLGRNKITLCNKSS
ncbi:MAG: Crp/Fnr family transcriptional regulator [Ignavibacteria bacterium]|nr:Crp/Fnr family transcriptional regulator [Ignavibacteria bacterium]